MTTFQRILVVGTSGSGKTTLAQKIAQEKGFSHTELDSIYHGPNWQPLDKELFREKVKAITENEKQWVIDGNYSAVKDIILKNADTLVWLDYKLSLVLKRVSWRTLSRLLSRKVLWNGNRESFKNFFHHENVILWALRTHSRNQREYASYANRKELSHLKILRFQTSEETERWIASF